MSKYFDIEPGKYDIPKVGKVNTFSKEVSDEKALAIYRLPRKIFPWIKLNKESLGYLKKQKFVAEDVAKMIQNARSVEEVETLSELSDTKTVERIKETKLNALKTP
ncbi:hypothetical protein [Mesonia mobilis]|uniref:hypothetical protein n=1 Tax=Mesonia mobilis TaxID=369791 RepID=UPI0024B95B4B|nr:hypothetical protein [Mesonia mobilis]